MPPAQVVVIATSGRAGLLARTLESLAACERPSGYRETVVIENGPRNGAERVIRAAPADLRARYLYTPVRNKSAALNAALATVGDVLAVFSDDDARFTERHLLAYAEASEGIERGKYFGGPVGVDREKEPPPWLAPYLPPSARGWSPQDSRNGPEHLNFLGINWAAFARDVVSAGGFDERLGGGAALRATGEETDLQERLRRRGCSSVFVPSAEVWHFVPAERCDPDWAIDHSDRQAAEVGQRLRRAGPGGAGLPRSVLGIVARALREGGPAGFRLRYAHGALRGLLRGYLDSQESLP